MSNHEQKTIRVVVANDQQVVREGLGVLLIGYANIDLLDYATSISETLRLVSEYQPDVLLVDPQMQGQDGLHALELLHGEWPHVGIVIFTATHNDEHLLYALHIGVCAYLPLRAECATILHAIHTAARGETLLQPAHMACLLTRNKMSVLLGRAQSGVAERVGPELTEREREVLQCVTYGERNKEIAARLGIGEPTVKTHLANTYFKLGVDSRASAVAVAIERGLLSSQRERRVPELARR